MRGTPLHTEAQEHAKCARFWVFGYDSHHIPRRLREGNSQQGSTPLDVARSLSAGLAREVLVARFNETLVDLTRPLETDGNLVLFKWDTPEGKATFWHSTAHLMAEALEAMYPGVKFGIGPPIAHGFYYDVDLGGDKLTPERIEALEAKILALAKARQRLRPRGGGQSPGDRLF